MLTKLICVALFSIRAVQSALHYKESMPPNGKTFGVPFLTRTKEQSSNIYIYIQ